MLQQMKMHDIRGVQTAIADTGAPGADPTQEQATRTLVMVHGGDVRSLSSAADWSTIWEPEAIGARLIAYDKPGQGRSYVPGMAEDHVSLPALIAHLEALVERLEAPVVLMGHSRGALPVAAVAQSRPYLVRGLILVSSNTLAPRSALTPTDFYLRAYADPPAVPDEEYVRRELSMNSYDDAHITADLLQARVDAAVESGWWADREHRLATYPAVEATLREGREAVLQTIEKTGFEMPVLTLWGHDDVSAPRQLGDALNERLMATSPEVTAIRVNHCGHYVYREHPKAFVGHVRAFLDAIAE